MKIQTEGRVTIAAITALGGPDAANVFLSQFNSVIEVFVRLGQLGVAIATIFYIYSKLRALKSPKRKPRK